MKNKCIIITGGTRGIGFEIARSYLMKSADVVVCARNSPASLPEHDGRKAVFIQADVRNPDQIKNLVEETEKQFGRIDVLINNAGGSPPVSAKDSSPGFNEKIIGLNLLAPLNLSIAVYPIMKKTGGVIINISSVSALRPNPMGAAYGAAKAGLINLSETLAAEWGPKIRVLTLTAGLIVTEDAHLYYGDEKGIKKVGETILMKRMGTPNDIAKACLFLSSDDAGWITGTNIKVHGGGENPAYLAASTGDVVEI